MSDRLKALYEEMILEHNKNPRHFEEISPCTHQAHGTNPICGDDFNIYINLKDGVIENIGFQGQGCAISKSSGSLLTQNVLGKNKEDVLKIKDEFLEMLIKDGTAGSNLGSLKVFQGVKQFPVRVKCATLIWRALESALENEGTKISTE